MASIRLLIAVLCAFPLFGLAQTGHYMVELEHDQTKTILAPEKWKASNVDDDTVEVDRGEADMEVHVDWNVVSYYDTTSNLVERYSIAHPSYAAAKNLKSFTSYVQRVDADGNVLETWPAVHRLAKMGGLVRIHSTYFPSNGSKVVVVRLYERGSYFLPRFFRKEFYAGPAEETPVQALTYRLLFVE